MGLGHVAFLFWGFEIVSFRTVVRNIYTPLRVMNHVSAHFWHQ
jgi:hypothetical protein